MSEETPRTKQAAAGISSLTPVSCAGATNPRHHPKNGVSNAQYAASHNITSRQASKQRRSEKHNIQ